MKIETVRSPGGVEAWLVEEYMVPTLTVQFAFEGGSSQDPVGKEGIATFLANMLKQGAGNMTELEFKERVADLAVRLGFRVEKDALVGSLDTLTENREEAAQLLNLVLTRPRFDADDVERIRQHLLTAIIRAARDPSKVANTLWNAVAFAGHAYRQPILGTAAAVGEIAATDLENYRARTFAKDKLKVVAVGAISPGDLCTLLDEAFGDLPAEGDLTPVPTISPAPGGRQTVVDMDVPQSVVAFGMGAIPIHDPDYMSAFVLNHVVGGSRFTSRLMEEVRVKRGLAHSVSTSLVPWRHASAFRGNLATRNVMVGESLAIVRAELEKMAAGRIDEYDLDNAKRFLIGSYPLRFDDNATIASQLMKLLLDGFGPDYVQTRGDAIAAVTLEDLKRIANKLFNTEDLIVTIVGKPVLQHATTG